MTAPRRLPLAGLHNCRDLGGFPVPGGVTRFGVFVRSEAPCSLPAADLDALHRYGVIRSLDLRSEMEQEARPSDLRGDGRFQVRSLPLFHAAAIPDGAVPAFKPWGEAYIDMLEGAKAWAAEALELAASAPGALLYHCTTGKDRTGILSCLLLSVAGVERADIAADYCVSEVYLQPLFRRIREGLVSLRGGDRPRGVGEDFFHTPACAMFTLLDHLDEHYGGAVGYLKQAGADGGALDAVRRKFVEAL